MALIAGTRLGPYEVIAQIGVGGMGEVYRARDTRLDRDVAIKVLPEAFDEACRCAGGVSRKTLYGAIREGRLQAGRIGAGRNVVVSDIAIDRWLEDARRISVVSDQERATRHSRTP